MSKNAVSASVAGWSGGVLLAAALVTGCATSDGDGGAGGGGDSYDAAKACVSGEPRNDGELVIVTTVAPITSIVSQIVGGTGASIEGVVPEGTNSHTFEPPPSAAKVLEEADIVFMNGLVLEEPTRELAEANLADGSVICELGTAILPRDEWIFDFSFPEEGGKPNPHLWTNPPMVVRYAGIVRDALSAMDPSSAAEYSANHDLFVATVDELDEAMATATATFPAEQRKLLTYHDAYAYFAVHYGWTVVGAIQPSSFEEPTPKDVVDLIEQVRSEGVRAVFGSEVFPSPVLEQIGRETGVRYVDVLRDDDLLGGPGDPEHSWLGLMRFNYVTMVESLGGDAAALRALDVSNRVPDRAEYPQ